MRTANLKNINNLGYIKDFVTINKRNETNFSKFINIFLCQNNLRIMKQQKF